MRFLSHPGRDDIALTAVFHALSDPIRLRIVEDLLAAGEMSCGSLDVPLNKSGLSHHLKVLRDAGVTFTRIEGTHRYMSVRREDIDARFPGLLDVVRAAAEPRESGGGRLLPASR